MRVGYKTKPPKPFNLLRSFSLLSLLSIGVISSTYAILEFRFLTDRILERDAMVTMEFVQTVVTDRNSESYFNPGEPPHDRARLEEHFEHIVNLQNVLRAIVYARDHSVVWSTEEKLIGEKFEGNPELKRALTGQVVAGLKHLSEDRKAEYLYFPDDVTEFVESYIPIWNMNRSEVIGAIEIYRSPRALFRALEQTRLLISLSAVAGGLFLYVILFWIVRRASAVMRQQQEQLVLSESLAVVGEMASAVAHGIRNPLAAIRSSAEVALEGKNPGMEREAAEDIIAEVDGLDKWLHELLPRSPVESGDFEAVCLYELIKDSLEGFSRKMKKQSVEVVLDLQEAVPPVRGDPAQLRQMFDNLIANALEAMPAGGVLTIAAKARDQKSIQLTLADTGQGIPPEQLSEVFKPFVTTKPSGLGLGLSLVRRILERHGGEIVLSSRRGQGTTVSLRLPARVE